MPVLCPGDEYVAHANQIELHDQRVKAGHIVELLALAAAACQLVYHITLVIRYIEAIAAAAIQVARIAGELSAGIQFGCGEDDAGHEPGGGYLAQKDDENGAQLPDAKVAHNVTNDIAARWSCWRRNRSWT